MRFACPWALLLFIPVIALLWRSAKPGASIGYSSLAVFPKGRETLRQRLFPLLRWLKILALASLVIALARPQRVLPEPATPRDGIAVELLVDISSSMEARMPFEGHSASRMEVTRHIIHDFITGGPGLHGRGDDLVGLISFARFADTLCPLTFSHDALIALVDSLQIPSHPGEDGTAIGDALALAAARLRTAEQQPGEQPTLSGGDIRSKVVVLLTDGENNCGRHLPLEAGALAQKWGIRVHVISITGDAAERVIPTRAGTARYLDQTDASQETLRRIAEMTGGIQRSASDGKMLRAIYTEIDQLEKSRIAGARVRVYRDRAQPFVITALAALTLGTLLNATFLRKIP